MNLKQGLQRTHIYLPRLTWRTTKRPKQHGEWQEDSECVHSGNRYHWRSSSWEEKTRITRLPGDMVTQTPPLLECVWGFVILNVYLLVSPGTDTLFPDPTLLTESLSLSVIINNNTFSPPRVSLYLFFLRYNKPQTREARGRGVSWVFGVRKWVILI